MFPCFPRNRSLLIAVAAGWAASASGGSASAEGPRATLIWEALVDDDGRLNERIDNERGAESADFSPDGTLVATAAKGDGSVRLLDAESGEQRWRADLGSETEAVAFTRDGGYVVAGGEGRRVFALRAGDGSIVCELASIASIEGLRFSLDGSRLATGNEAGVVELWDTSAADPSAWPAEPLAALLHGPDRDRGGPDDAESDVNQVDFSPDGYLLYSGGRDGTVKQWDLRRIDDARTPGVPVTEPRRTFDDLPGSIKGVRLSPAASLVAASATRGGGRGAGVAVWEVGTGALLASWRAEPSGRHNLETVAFTPDGRHVLAGGTFPADDRPQPLLVFDLAAWRAEGDAYEPSRIDMWRQEYVTFSPDGRLMLTAHDDGGVRLWEFSATERVSAPGDARPPRCDASGRRGSGPLPCSPAGRSRVY